MLANGSSSAFVLASTGERIVILAQPRILADKSAWSQITCWREFLPLPREFNARGLVLHHHVYDRVVFTSSCRHQLPLQHAKKLQAETRQSLGDSFWDWSTSFFTAAPCASDDAHNVVEWVTSQLGVDKTTARLMFLLKSLRCFVWCDRSTYVAKPYRLARSSQHHVDTTDITQLPQLLV